MAIVLSEHDLGSKEKLRKALRRTFVSEKDWKMVWDQFWAKVEEDAKMFCPVETGALRSTIQVVDIGQAPEIAAPEFAAIAVPVVKPQTDTRCITAGDINTKNPISRKGVTYAQAVHDGHVSKGGRWIEGNPFLSDAVDINMAYLDELIKKYIDKEIAKFSGE